MHQAAKYLCVSESTLTHFLRYEHRTSFKELLIARRLDHAEKLLKHDPALTIAEAARQSGFNDPHYFSRLYRRKRGVTPRCSRRAADQGV